MMVAKRNTSSAEVATMLLMRRHSKQLATFIMPLVFPLLLLLLCFIVDDVHCSTVHENSEDFHALLDFKQNISDPKKALSNWNLDTHFCHWNGVNCSLTPPWRVTGLNLAHQGLGGQISPSLGNLTFLKSLLLANNSFVGPIPPPLGNLQHLESLNLQGNILHGAIPDTLTNCSNLIGLDLSQNQLTGVIHPSIDSLSKLRLLFLYENNLTGVIPTTLGNITTLTQIDFSQNQLNGKIPENVWQMPTLEFLNLAENHLSGLIPHIPSNTSSLTALSLSGNFLGSALPFNMGDAFPNLEQLLLANNNFQGHIPASLGNASRLVSIDLSLNNFTGQIPSSFGRILVLSSLNLGTNHLEAKDNESWEFFHDLANCNSLNTLVLSNNQLQGSIPNSIGNLSSELQYLQMGGNQLSGSVPSNIKKLDGLVELSLDHNILNGTIEDWIGNLKNLQHLNLCMNNFTGTIPPSINNLTQLILLSIAENEFTGFLPPSMGNLISLNTLNLSYNNFNGSIPIEFGKFSQLITLDLSSNNFSGEIPKTFGQFKHINAIRMDQNLLVGNIPSTFRNLMSLSMLNVSHNHLSGSIPAFLNDLNSLNQLDLSYNSFQGEIPNGSILNNATVVSLDGNRGLCGGAMNFHLPPCHVIPRRVGLVNYLVKILIPIFGFMSLALLLYFLFIEKKVSRRAYFSQQSFGEHFEKVTYNDLAQATRDFSESNLIGRGSYGSVYSGKLKESKMEIAVKVFDLEMRGAERSFMAECEALRSIQHRNLLPIITACSTVDNTGNVFKALVYELMPNGNLDTWLHHKGDEEAPKRLSLAQRISIVINVADALDYLHHDCGRPIVHCDLKPSNILLDDDMNALLGDFGIARFYDDHHITWAASVSSIGLKGTIGYIPPEYGGGGPASTSGDVYSFGILMLEILTGKRPTDPMFVDGLDITTFVENYFPEQIFHVIDAYLVEECNSLTQEKNVPQKEIYKCMVDLLQVALACTRSLPSERSNMKKVASKLHAIKTSHLG